jgi:hypothetical protein
MAEMLKEILHREGILVMLRSLGVPQMGAGASYEILVPEGEVEDAQEVLNSTMGR